MSSGDRQSQTWAFDLALVSMELLAANRKEGRLRAVEGRLEQWLEGLASSIASSATVGCPVRLPSYSRNVTIRFEDPEVRKKLVKLMDTDVVKIMDKDFMHDLQNKLYESHWVAFEERLAARRKWESERRKKLALEGIQPLDDNSLNKHPIIQVKKEVEKALDVIRDETRKPYQTRKRMVRDYKQFTIEPDEEESSIMSSNDSLFEKFPVANLDNEELEKQIKALDIKAAKEPDSATLMSEQFFQKIKYESPLVRKLREAEVDAIDMQILVAILCCSLTVAVSVPQELEETMGLANSIPLDLAEGGEVSDPDQLSDYLSSLLADDAPLPLVYLPEKRSRYYRRYPWKRQNGRNYEPDSYLCTPTRQDVFHLLMALHDARSGNQDRTVHFCNRRRPARAIFTNIRFLGRR